MLFSSPIFLFAFLPIVIFLYLISPQILRNTCLLVASLFFYAWGDPGNIKVMLLIIGVNYFGGLIIAEGLSRSPLELLPEASARTRFQQLGLVFSLFINLGILAGYKYLFFLSSMVSHLLVSAGMMQTPLGIGEEITLPLGVSFFTFQAMSYTIDVYRGKTKATRNIINFATYISLFPQLIAGPIVRHTQIAQELEKRSISFEKVSSGLRRFSIGLGKKVLIANVLAWPVDQIFSLPDSQLSMGLAWLAIICYTFQIYFDFSGYSDMAIGLGEIFGFTFPENFKYPYISQSIQQFWHRWHISLSTWFRDYLYIPLGGNQQGNVRTYFNLITVFFLCGLWHGASWTFVIWGLYHGIFLLAERLFLKKRLASLYRPIRHGYAFIVVLFGWLIFRAETFPKLITFSKAMVGMGSPFDISPSIFIYLNSKIVVILLLAIVGSTPWLTYIEAYFQAYVKKSSRNTAPLLFAKEMVVLFFCISIFTFSLMSISASTHNPFIYFRF